jgi:hypothetical protein
MLAGCHITARRANERKSLSRRANSAERGPTPFRLMGSNGLAPEYGVRRRASEARLLSPPTRRYRAPRGEGLPGLNTP